jgi:hypothetical protein
MLPLVSSRCCCRRQKVQARRGGPKRYSLRSARELTQPSNSANARETDDGPPTNTQRRQTMAAGVTALFVAAACAGPLSSRLSNALPV